MLEQVNICLENLEKANDFQQIIIQHWKYYNDECCNQNNLYYVNLWDDKHYSVSKSQHEVWINAITAENAVIDQSSDQIYNYLKFEQNSVDQKYQKSDFKEKKNKKSSINLVMSEMLIFQQEQMKMIMQQQIFDSMNCF